MKRLFTPPVAVLFSIVLFSCSGPDTGKFTGKWTSLNNRYIKGTMTIRQKGEVFEATPDNEKGQQPMVFTYDKDRDVLTMDGGSDIVDLRYIPETNHLVMAPRLPHGMGPSAIEFEKVH